MGYAEIVAALSIPSVDQTGRFAAFVARAHSWYKHLPAFPPGAPFHFFLDPNAGRSQVLLPGGEVGFADRVDEKESFHYTWMRTDEYRERFGHWHYSTNYGTQIMAGSPRTGWKGTASLPRVLSPDGEWVDLPEGLLEAGSCSVTSFVYTSFQRVVSEQAINRFPDRVQAFAKRAELQPEDPEVIRYRPLLDLVVRENLLQAEFISRPDELREFYDKENPHQFAILRETVFRARSWLAG